MSVLRGLGCHVLTALIVTSRKRTITAWSAGLSSRLASNHGLHGFFIRLNAPECDPTSTGETHFIETTLG